MGTSGLLGDVMSWYYGLEARCILVAFVWPQDKVCPSIRPSKLSEWRFLFLFVLVSCFTTSLLACGAVSPSFVVQ